MSWYGEVVQRTVLFVEMLVLERQKLHALKSTITMCCKRQTSCFKSPTGVFAVQHMQTVMKRMGEESDFNFDIHAKMWDGKEHTNGDIDIIVGTHALLSSGMNFKDLGLLSVDEEERFGVKQKERFKLICSGIDVLTLSATPIPRTLQMSLSGIRDTLTIRSPPPMRKPTITFVQELNKIFIKDAIARELERGGLCFFMVPGIAHVIKQ